MKIIKLKLKENFKYKRKVIIKNLILNIFIGIHNFEKKKKQRVRFNIEVVTNPNIKPNNKDLSTILNYEDLINKIELLVKKKHHELIEDLAENIFEIIFQNRLVKKINIKIEKLDIIKNSESVGVEFSKVKYD
jgi:dihydroneopterin aldolase